jgi:hypothetical protein
MSAVRDKPLPLSSIYEEFNMSPARDPHNDFVGALYRKLWPLLEDTEFTVKFDTFRYLDDWLINAFGDFKNVVNLNTFVAGLRRFGASKRFIQSKLDEYTGMGTIPMGYAPDVFIVEKAERDNEFGIPLVVFEVISTQSRQNDLCFKPFFYETIGVREMFVCEPGERIDYARTGTIIKAYRLQDKLYQPIPCENDSYFSEVIGLGLPRMWEI